MWGGGSGRRDVGRLHDDAGAHLVGVAAGRRGVGVVAVRGRPAAGVVADDGRRVARAGDPEVGLAAADERGHAGQRAGNPEDGLAVVPLPDGHLSEEIKNKNKKREEEGEKSHTCVENKPGSLGPGY